MSFLKEIRRLFSRPGDERPTYGKPVTVRLEPGKSSTGWPFYKSLPIAGDWTGEQPQEWIIKKGDWDVPSGFPLLWVNRVTGETRRPEEKTRVVESEEPFLAAGRRYGRPQELMVRRKEDDPTECWVMDCHGRKVFYLSEPYPVFDSYDRIYEDRLFRWMYLCEDGVLTCVYLDQDSKRNPRIIITEDAASLGRSAWEAMEKVNYLECR